MDALSSIFTWLSDHEAGISAVVGIAVLAGIVFAGVRALHLRGASETLKKASPRQRSRGLRSARNAPPSAAAAIMAGAPISHDSRSSPFKPSHTKAAMTPGQKNRRQRAGDGFGRV